DGSMIGLNKDILSQYVEYITNLRIGALGFEPLFPVKSNPLPWINAWLNSDNVQVAPQEAEISSYLVGAIDSEVNTDDLGDFDLCCLHHHCPAPPTRTLTSAASRKPPRWNSNPC